MRIKRTLSTILRRCAERLDIRGPVYPKRHNALAFNILSEDRPTIHAARAASWELKKSLASPIELKEPHERGQPGRSSAHIIPTPIGMRIRDGIWPQSKLTSSAGEGYLELVFGRIASHLSGNLSDREFFNSMPPILQPRFKFVLQFLKKYGIAVLNKRSQALSNGVVSIDHGTSFNNMTSGINTALINNMISMSIKPHAKIKLEPPSTNTGILSSHYHAEKSLLSKIRSNESALNLLYYGPRKENDVKATTPVPEMKFERESISIQDTTQFAALDLDRFSDQICSIIAKRMKVERERRGLYG
jgi:hypothetical protein